MIEVNIHEAKKQLSRLLARVAEGEEVIIARAGQPVARLVPVTSTRGRRRSGTMRGKIRIAADFDAPLDPETLDRDS
ncbi:MAG TPA: type II toxin-antitoxin system prevent-host-death family antitoxin [Thermoanaerobaculia bacterium]|nr:type II toxin-antitoxin system prevent-host-death family antitoxin [Thermoanaerobaculia bacterium]